jgi:DNA mismatch repair ATPase MutS
LLEGAPEIMNVFLMYKDCDFDLDRKLPWNEKALMQDLELKTLFNAMALGDEFLFEVARKAVLCGEDDLDTILYRQNILKDCLKNTLVARSIYALAVEATERVRKSFFFFYGKTPSLYSCIELLVIHMDVLKKLKTVIDNNFDKFGSEGFSALFAMLRKELSDEYFATVQGHLNELNFRRGILISAELGKGNEGINHVLRKPTDKKRRLMQRIFSQKQPGYTFYLHPRDDAGAKILSEIQDRGIRGVVNALAQSTEHLRTFFATLRTELAFYIGCLNLHERLAQMGAPTAFPQPAPAEERRHSSKGLYDACLALTMKQKIVGNDLSADNKNLVIITGANQGGKSTFLRSIGLSQLMMQSGMFVLAESFRSSVCDGIFTHFKREEDSSMKSGKLDEELGRMSEIVDGVHANSMILFNESFAATNEREGSEIARQIISALTERGVKVYFVTFLSEFAHGFYNKKMENAIFLRAERQDDGGRNFKIVEGEPLRTGYGRDLYATIFGMAD